MLQGKGRTAGGRHRRVWKVRTEGGMGVVPKGIGYGKAKKGGRGIGGQRVVRHRGGGEKQRGRKRVNGSLEGGTGRVRGIQKDPKRTGRVARRKVLDCAQLNGVGVEYKYVLAVEGRTVGNVVQYGVMGSRPSNEMTRNGDAEMGRRGSTMRRRDVREGEKVCNLEIREGKGGQRRRSAGIRGEVRKKETGWVVVRRKGGRRRRVKDDCTAVVGSVSGEGHFLRRRGKAGSNRHRGIRPTVRGEAMNPIDHPHGGRTRGGKPEVTPWAKRAKGVPTRKGRKGRGWSRMKG